MKLKELHKVLKSDQFSGFYVNCRLYQDNQCVMSGLIEHIVEDFGEYDIYSVKYFDGYFYIQIGY